VLSLLAPLSGRTLALADVPDEAFACGALGEGLAIEPDEAAPGEVRAPVSGRVEVLFPTGHAVALRSPEGVEVLVHVGLDSMNAADVFTPAVAQGDEVKAGDILVRFDLVGLKRSARSVVTPVVVTGMPEGLRLEISAVGQRVTAGREAVLTVSK
jgi:glucose-specific phosphotransferase system IIA component